MLLRPKSVTIIAWILIVTGVGGLIFAIFSWLHPNPTAVALMQKSPLPLSLQYSLMFLGTGVNLVSGIAMLKGKNWGRFLYVGISVLSLLITLITSPIKVAVIPGIAFLAIVTFFLFRPQANAYFGDASVNIE